MTTEEREWWEKMIWEEEERVKLWDSPTEEDYAEAGNTFDLLEFKYAMPDPDPTQIKMIRHTMKGTRICSV